jgi:hypothetical protein
MKLFGFVVDLKSRTLWTWVVAVLVALFLASLAERRTYLWTGTRCIETVSYFGWVVGTYDVADRICHL